MPCGRPLPADSMAPPVRVKFEGEEGEDGQDNQDHDEDDEHEGEEEEQEGMIFVVGGVDVTGPTCSAR